MAYFVDIFGHGIPLGGEEDYYKSGKMSCSCGGEYLRMMERQQAIEEREQARRESTIPKILRVDEDVKSPYNKLKLFRTD